MNEMRMSPTARFVRRIWPRRNDMMRSVDWVQAAVLLAVLTLSLVLLPIALAAGSEAYAAQSRISSQQSQTRHPATAILEADAPATDTSDGLGYAVASVTAPVRAHWQVPGGGTRVGTVSATSGLHAGDDVAIWLDQNGNVADAPLAPADATATGIGVAALIWLSAAGFLAAAYVAVIAGLNRRRSAAWARAWAQVEPDWSHRT